MSISRRFILSELFERFEVTPKDEVFTPLAKELILVHYDRTSDQLLDSKKFDEEVRLFKSKSNSYFKKRKTRGSYKEFIEDPKPNTDYFDGLIFPPEIKSDLSTPSTSGQLGRPPLAFKEMGRSRRSEAVKECADDHELEELLEATIRKLKRLGHSDAAKVVKFLAEDPETNGKKTIKALSIKGTLLVLPIISKHF